MIGFFCCGMTVINSADRELSSSFHIREDIDNSSLCW